MKCFYLWPLGLPSRGHFFACFGLYPLYVLLFMILIRSSAFTHCGCGCRMSSRYMALDPSDMTIFTLSGTLLELPGSQYPVTIVVGIV